MKKGYWVVAYRSISDESGVKAYAALARRQRDFVAVELA